MIIVCQSLLKNTKILGITLYPFIFLREKRLKNDKILINHERIHLRQQAELLVVFFYLWYVLEFFCWYVSCQDWDTAYRKNSFEKEAYDRENNLEYLKNRKLWSFLRYFNK